MKILSTNTCMKITKSMLVIWLQILYFPIIIHREESPVLNVLIILRFFLSRTTKYFKVENSKTCVGQTLHGDWTKVRLAGQSRVKLCVVMGIKAGFALSLQNKFYHALPFHLKTKYQEHFRTSNFFSFTEHSLSCHRQAFMLAEHSIRSEDNQTTMPLYVLLS